MKAKLKTFLFGLALAVVFLGLGFAASGALAGGSNGHGPPTGGPPGQGECAHGNSGKDCKPDPQPGHGQECDEHGHGGVNEDHCTGTTPTDTTPTDTTHTDTTPTTPVPTTPEQPRCPAGEGPYDGKDGDESEPGHNDECCPDSNNNQVCDYKETTLTPAKRGEVPTLSTAQTTATTTTATSSTAVAPAAKVAKVKKVARAKAVVRKKHAVATKLTGNPKVDRCKQENGLFECQPGGPGTPKVTVVPGQG